MAAALLTARRMHTLTALPDGRVLAAGGITGGQVWPVPGLTSAEVYDPVSGAWTPTGAMAVPRHGHSATVLTDGRVLVAAWRACALGPRQHHARLRRDLRPAHRCPDGDGSHGRATLEPPSRPASRRPGPRHRRNGQRRQEPQYPPRLVRAVRPERGGVGTHRHSVRPPVRQAVRLADGSVLVVGGGRPGQSDEAGCDPHSLADAERYDAAASGSGARTRACPGGAATTAPCCCVRGRSW